jgi:Glycosyltransferase sugar-binding region containing DXD motif
VGGGAIGGDGGIVQYWHAPPTPADVQEHVATFKRLNPDLRHRIFSESEASDFIAAHLTERELAAFQACAVPAMQADYFRYCALFVQGGIYSDVDYRCLNPLATLAAESDAGMLFRTEPESHLTNAFFLFDESGHPFPRLALDVATQNIERRAGERVNVVSGPWIFSILATLHDRGAMDRHETERAGPGMKRLLSSVFDAVGDFKRITEAFEGVRIAPFELARKWIDHPPRAPRYKQGDDHWVNWRRSRGSIFR